MKDGDLFPDQRRIVQDAVNKFNAAVEVASMLPRIQDRREVHVSMTVMELWLLLQATNRYLYQTKQKQLDIKEVSL